jgi:hypothetical protein
MNRAAATGICTSFLDVHFGHIRKDMVQSITGSRIHRLLGLHGRLHNGMVGFERIAVIFVTGKGVLLDPLAQAILCHSGDDFGAVLFFGSNPTNDSIETLQISSRMQILGCDHSFANGCRMLFQFGHHCGVVENSTGDLAMSATQPQDQVECGFFLDIVVTQGSSIFQLLSGKDQTLLIRGDSFLVLDLGLDIVDTVRGLDIEGDGLSSQRFHKNLQCKHG